MNWRIIENRLVKTYQLLSFSEIAERLNALSLIADAHKHHPDFKVYEYNKIRFELWTHDENDISVRDYRMADIIDQLFD